MINLPEKLRDSAYVDVERKQVIWHFKNAADQYFTNLYFLDAAIPASVHLERIKALDFRDIKAYTVHDNLTTQFIEPTDQMWHPAPIPFPGLISLAQFMADEGLKAKEGQ